MQKTTGSTFGKDKYFSRKRQVKQCTALKFVAKYFCGLHESFIFAYCFYTRFSEWVTKSNKGNNIYTKYHILIYL